MCAGARADRPIRITAAEQEFGLMEPVRLTAPRMSSFYGYDASLLTSYFNAGVKLAPVKDLYNTGPLILIAGGSGISPAGGFTAALTSAALTQQARILAGYQFVNGGTSLAVFAGPSMTWRQEVWIDRMVYSQARQLGLAVQAELWSRLDRSTLVTAVFAYTGDDRVSWARLHVGRRVRGSAFLGPEMSASTDGAYRQIRAGLRLTGLNLGRLALDIAAGGARDNRDMIGPYVTLTLYGSLW